MNPEPQDAAPRPGTRRWLGWLVSAVFAAVLVYFLVQYRDAWQLLSGITIAQALGLTALAVSGIAVNGFKLSRILHAHGIRLPAQEAFGLASVSAALNSLFFKSGALAVSHHLKQRHGFSYARFIGTLGADHLILMFINAAMGGGAALYLTFHLEKPFGWAAAAFFGLAGTLVFIRRRRFRFQPGGSRLSHALAQAFDSLDGLLNDKPLIRSLCVLNGALLLIVALRLHLAFSVIGIDVSFVSCILFTTVMAFVRLLPMLQSDLGSRELTVGFLSRVLGTGFQAGLIAAVVDRLFEWLTAFVLAFWYRDLFIAAQRSRRESRTHPIPSARP